jgi:hypothetical protein
MKHTLTCTIGAALVAAFSFSGCTTVTGATYAGYETGARKGVEVANDNAIRTLADSICGMPYGAILRNTYFIPVAKAACLPAGAANAPDTTLPASSAMQAAPATAATSAISAISAASATSAK